MSVLREPEMLTAEEREECDHIIQWNWDWESLSVDEKQLLKRLVAQARRAVEPPSEKLLSSEGLDNKATIDHPDAYLNALLDYAGGLWATCRKAGVPSTEVVDAVQHIERAARGLHAKALLAASPTPPAAGGETGWLVEGWNRKTGELKAEWWSLDPEFECGGWTKDSLKAVRFCRERDAQAFIDDIVWTEAKPTEHRWG